MKVSPLWLACLVVLLVGPSRGLAAPGYRFESYGDSLTAGFLSDANLTSPPPLKQVSKIISDLAMFLLTQKPEYTEPHHARAKAWPNQLADLLRKDGTAVDLVNNAVSGSASWDLSSQLVASGSDSTAFFFSGHNDICENTEPVADLADRFERSFEEAISRWDAGHMGSKAVVLPVSRIDRVFATLKGHVWFKSQAANYRCEDCWKKFFPYCPSFYRMHKDGTLRDFIEPRVEAMNAALERVVDKWNRTSKANAFYFLKDVHEVAFRPDYFSIDCYHLGSYGQSELGLSVRKAGHF
jgi:hypothetical protein